MFEGLAGKRLLYLGGVPRARYVVDRAKKLGIYVIVVDLEAENSPAKAAADEAIYHNAKDVDWLVDLCKEKKIDGIATGYIDFLLPVCRELSDRTGIPYYATEGMILQSTDKLYFKRTCEKYGVPVPKTYEIDLKNIESSAKKLSYPVFVKPRDASGARGASVCYKAEDLKGAVDFALSFSKRKVITVEEFLEGTEFILDYIIIDGKAQLMSMADRYSTSDRGKAINNSNLMLLPSKNIDRYLETVDPKVKAMFEGEKYKDGIIFLQGYVNENYISFYEMEGRLGGTWPFVDEYFHKVNPLDMMFNQTITGHMIDPGTELTIDARFDGCSSIIYFLSNAKEGKISKIEGLNEIKSMPEVVSVLEYYHEGDVINAHNLNDVLLIAVHMAFRSYEEMKEKTNYVYSTLKIFDENRNSLIAPVIDIDSIKGYSK
ncbi:hypothetical protein [uncultured Dysosmobacter sp.]|uniref:ATP-binding protein n=1 Tax=uncultured Dysosmobacter sp. TaxID=2591384 RepID=UPI00261513CB|nr:hypothetical protein [uncultured Dysosmobacter sp.]